MPERENIFAYTEPNAPTGGYVGYLSLNREADGRVTLTVRERGDGTQATIELPHAMLVMLAGALKHDAAGLAGAGG